MKKAIAVTELVVILLAIVAGIGLLFYMKSGTEKVGCKADVEICKNTFLLYQRWRSLKWAGVAPRMDCVAVSLPNCDQKDIESDDKNQNMYIIAENLRYCWDKTLGKQNTMGEDFAYNLFGVVGKDVDFCLVCSEFTPNADISPAEWNNYLDTKNVPGAQVPYAQIIQPTDKSLIWPGTSKSFSYRDIGFKKGTRYYVVSVSAESSMGNSMVYAYIDSEISCGQKDPQIHYQLK